MNDLFETSEPNLKWWGEFEFTLSQSYAWRFGSLYFRLIRKEKEWRVEYYRPQSQHESQQTWQKLDPEELFPQPMKFERYMFNATNRKILLVPRLADRSVVIKPVQPIYIHAGQKASLFISTPLWICGFVEGQKQPLFDFPVIQPKDTWFGLDKMNGQLCYSTPVDGSTDLKLLKPRAFRAVTPIHFYNDSNQQMRLERINVPVPSLPLFHSEETGRLWTSEIKVMQDSVDKPPRIRIENRTPTIAGKVTFVQPARADSSSSIMPTMFESLF